MGHLWPNRTKSNPSTARKSNQSILKEINSNIHWKDWCWSWSSNTLTTWCKEPTHWKRPWCWERLKAGGEGDDRGWDCWMASLTQWTWVWASSGRWWKTGSLTCCSPWGHKELGMTEWLNNYFLPCPTIEYALHVYLTRNMDILHPYHREECSLWI